MRYTIYVTEDEENIRELIRCTLESFGYGVECFETAEEMLEKVKAGPPSLFLLDVMLPGIDGITALKRLRADQATRNVPVIMLTAKSSEVDKVTGLDAGADDYIAKPFGVLELTARLRAVLRRADSGPAVRSRLTHDGLCVDVDSHEATLGGVRLELTLKEFSLLRTLMENAGRVLSRDELLDKVWGYEYAGETRTLDMHIRSLRQKLGDEAEHPRFIQTVRGIGYKFKG